MDTDEIEVAGVTYDEDSRTFRVEVSTRGTGDITGVVSAIADLPNFELSHNDECREDDGVDDTEEVFNKDGDYSPKKRRLGELFHEYDDDGD